MFFRKKDSLVGLDIGSAMVKAAELVPSKKGYSLKSFAALPLEPGSIKDGLIQDPDHVSKVIQDLFFKNKISNDRVAIAIGGYSAITKKILMPVMDDDSLQKNILVEAEQYIPFDIKDIRMDFQVMGPADSNAEQLNILLVAAKKDLVNQYVDVVESAGLLPCIVDVDTLAVQNIYEYIYGLPEEETALLHVGASRMSFNIIKEGDTVFTRDIPYGTDQINLKIKAKMACSDEEAESLKLASGGVGLSLDEYELLVEDIIGQWCAEIGKAMNFFYSTHQGDRVERIMLSGGGAHTRGFSDALSMQTGSEIVFLNPFEAIEIAGRLDKDSVLSMSAQAAVCMGLALRRVEDK